MAAEGHTVLSPAAARRLIVASADRQPARDRARHLAGSLTDREAQVLACLGEGLSSAQIAARLYLSGARVKGYVSRMLDELGCANRAQAGLLAHDAPVSSARSPGRRSCRLELGLGARQAGLRPSPGRSCPPWRRHVCCPQSPRKLRLNLPAQTRCHAADRASDDNGGGHRVDDVQPRRLVRKIHKLLPVMPRTGRGPTRRAVGADEHEVVLSIGGSPSARLAAACSRSSQTRPTACSRR